MLVVTAELIISQAATTVCATGAGSYDSNLSPDTAASGGATLRSFVGTPRNGRISVVAQIILRCSTQPRVDTLSLRLAGIDDAISIGGTFSICRAILTRVAGSVASSSFFIEIS